MAFRDRIEVVVDFVTAPAQRNLSSLKSEVQKTDGFVNKAKVGFKGLGDFAKNYAAEGAALAGAALVAFGAKSVQAFTDSALAAGKFADATGLTTEEASRLIEVAGDLGVSAEAVQASIQRVNNAAAKGDLAKFGIEIATAKDGAYDANQTFLNTVEAIGNISSAAEREAAARKLMGRSWAELAELATMSAEDLAAALADVSDKKVFDDAEVRRAREYRAAMDNLKDAVEDITLAVGNHLTPAITEAAETIDSFRDVADVVPDIDLPGWVNSLVDAFESAVNPVKAVTDLIGDLDKQINGTEIDASSDSWGRLIDKYREANPEIVDLADELDDQADAAADTAQETLTAADSMDAAATSADTLRTALENLIGEERDAIQARRDSDAAARAYDEALAALGGTMLDAEASTEDLDEATRNAADAAIKASEDFAVMEAGSLNSAAGVDAQIKSLEGMAAELEPGSPLRKQLDAYIAQLRSIPTQVNTQLNVTVNGPVGIGGEIGGTGGSGVRAGMAGTFVQGASSAWNAALSAWNAVRPSSGPADRPVEPTKGDRFDKELETAKRKYERGWYDADEYRAELLRLQRKYKFRPLSTRGMTLFRELKRVREDMRENEKGPKGDRDKDKDPIPPREPGGMPPGPASTTRPKGRGRAEMVAGGSGAGGVTINAVFPNVYSADRRSIQKAMNELAPYIVRGINRHEKEQG